MAALVIAWTLYRAVDLMLLGWGHVSDDAYITLRYAQHLAQGHGIAWNVGEERVEGYSNFLFVLVGAAAHALGADPMLTLRGVCCAAYLGTCLVLFALARLWVGPLAAVVPALLLTEYPGTALWAVSGLETALYQFAVASGVLLFLRGRGFRPDDARAPADARTLAMAGAVLFAASITRAEGPVVPLVLGACLAGSIGLARLSPAADPPSDEGRVLRAGMAFAFCWGVPYTLYFAWRWAYFGQWLPNSVLCKQGLYYLVHGGPWTIIENFWQVAWPALLLSLAWPLRRLDLRHASVLALTAAYFAILYDVSPVVSRHNRHFLGVLALVLVTATAGADAILRYALRLRVGIARGALVLVLALALVPWGRAERERTIEQKAAKIEHREVERRRLSRWLRRRLAPDEWLVLGDVGLIGYLVDAKILDYYCLNSEEMTRPPISRDTRLFLSHTLTLRPEVYLLTSGARGQLRRPFAGFAATEEFRADYQQRRMFGGPGFYYWIFERRDHAMLGRDEKRRRRQRRRR